jgi:hypothetical protein
MNNIGAVKIMINGKKVIPIGDCKLSSVRIIKTRSE